MPAISFRGGRWMLLFAAAVLAVPPSVYGQTATTPAPPPGSQAAEATTVRKLSVADAVQLALEQNLNLQVQRLAPQMQELNIAQVRSYYVPTVTAGFTTTSKDSPSQGFLSGVSTGAVTQDNLGANVGARQYFPWGANYQISWDSSRDKTNSLFLSPNPLLTSSLNFTYTQSLVRNFKVDNVRNQLLINRKNREISDVQLRQMVLTTVRNVKNAYWELEYARASLEVQRQSLELAQQSLKDNESRVRIGTMAPIDIVTAQAEVARNEEAVILAEANVSRAEDGLRTIVFDPATPGFWSMRLEPTDRPALTTERTPIDVDAAIRAALDKRTDLVQARKTLEQTDLNIRYYRNQTLPDVNIQAGYGLMGQGGTDIPYDPITGTFGIRTTTGYGSVLHTLLANDFPSWSVGVSVGYPIGKSSADVGLAQARLQQTQTKLQIRNGELQVASQVREMARQVNTNLKRVDATRASRELAEKRLEAEQKKFAAGMSTSFFVFQAQRDLADARNTELRALLDYNQSLVDFETVQQAPISSSTTGSLILNASSVATTGATTTGQTATGQQQQ